MFQNCVKICLLNLTRNIWIQKHICSSSSKPFIIKKAVIEDSICLYGKFTISAACLEIGSTNKGNNPDSYFILVKIMDVISTAIYRYVCRHACMQWKQHKHLLVFVHGVNEDGPACLIAQNTLEHPLIEVRNPWLGDKKVKPWVRHVPQTLGPELQLGLVDPVQKIHVRKIRCEDRRGYKIQFF